jgi:hypothetical protein
MFSFRHKTRNDLSSDGVTASTAKFSVPGYSAHYGATVQPTAGAMAYAYESLALVPFPPSGPSIATRHPINPTTPPLYALQSIPVAGYGGIVAGQMSQQPLFNPYGGGYSGDAPAQFTFIPNAVDPETQRRRTI